MEGQSFSSVHVFVLGVITRCIIFLLENKMCGFVREVFRVRVGWLKVFFFALDARTRKNGAIGK